VALLQAKEESVVGVVYQPSHDAEHRRRVLLVAELRRALADEGLSLHYQPLVNMTDRVTIGFEALLRWSHPTSAVSHRPNSCRWPSGLRCCGPVALGAGLGHRPAWANGSAPG